MKKKIKLSNVTLVAVTSIKEDLVQDALKISSHEIEFSSIKFLTSKKPKIKFSEIEYIDVPEMNLNEYCNFLVKDLYKYFETSHCLLIQEDSFVVNPNQWKQEYLNYDYIGAPWTKIIQPIKNKNIELKNRVGNGGFSLRSKNLLSACKDLDFNNQMQLITFLKNISIAGGLLIIVANENRYFSIDNFLKNKNK